MDTPSQWLAAHNSRRSSIYRQKRYSSKLVKWSEELAAQAADWADTLISQEGIVFLHAGEDGFGEETMYGENLGGSLGAPRLGVTPEEVVSGWFSDKLKWDELVRASPNGHWIVAAQRSTGYIGCAQRTKWVDEGYWWGVQVCRYAGAKCYDGLDLIFQEETGCPETACPPEGCF